MEVNRAEALAKGEKTFIGNVCSKDEDHGDERYASSGRCVVCATETSRDQSQKRSKRRKAIMGAAEVEALMLRGGANDKETAIAAGLPWYNPPPAQRESYCHWIVGVDGYCTLCGRPTPEPVTVKQELDLAARLLS